MRVVRFGSEERKKNCYLKKKKEFISFLASKLQNPLLC